jgi:hypothetical protein
VVCGFIGCTLILGTQSYPHKSFAGAKAEVSWYTTSTTSYYPTTRGTLTTPYMEIRRGEASHVLGDLPKCLGTPVHLTYLPLPTLLLPPT